MPASAPPRNRFPPNGRSKPAPATKKKTTAATTKPGTRPKKARAHREGDEDIVREARSDDDLQSDADNDDDDDDDDSSFTSSIASVPERALTRKASNGNGKAQPTASVAGSSTLPIMQFPDEDVNGGALLSSLHTAHHAWSDMVAHADGEDLPVLDFADMRAPSPVGEDEPDSTARTMSPHSEAKRGAGSAVHRPIGVSARKAYLQRLEADPSYTPRVGEFWSHDERLLDKDLRSLSGWWRGRWRGRGGRGGFATGWVNRRPGGRFSGREQWGVASESNDPTDQDWRHDGYEEIEQAKEAKAPRQATEQSSGRGGFWSARGRGRNGALRGDFHFSDSLKPSNETSSSHEHTPQTLARPSPTPRLWYRPEYAWTRHAATYLFSDGSPKPRFGGGGRLRVKLPGQTRYTFVRLPPVGTKSETASTPSQPTRQFVVRLPKVKGSEEDGGGEEAQLGLLAPPALQQEDAHTVALPPLPDELSAPVLASVSAPSPSSTLSPKPTPAAHEPAVPPATSDTEPPASTPLVQTSTLLLSEPAPAQQGTGVAPTMPPPPPVNQSMVQMGPAVTAPSPSYPSPSYPPAPFPYPLHHPVATYPAPMQEPMWYDPRMPYGYPTPPPAPQNMYTPPPPPPAMHHHHSHSISLPPMMHPQHASGFYGMPPPPAPRPTPIEQLGPSISYGPNGAMVDMATGTPIFSLAKPRVRVNIRKPSESPSPSTAPNESISSEGSSRALTSESAPTEEPGRSKILEQGATEPAQTFSANNPYAPQARQQQQWDPYGNPMGGYYYPPPPHMHTQQYPSSAEFGYPSGVPQAPSGYPSYPDSIGQGPPADFQHPPQHPPIFY